MKRGHIYLFRHGRTNDNVDGEFSGWHNSRLVKSGFDDAKIIAERLKNKKFQVAMTHAERFSNEGNWNEALRAYRFALAEFPNDLNAIVGFGRSAYSSGQIEIAQRAFGQVLKLDPSNWQALNYLGDIQEELGQLDQAGETYFRVGNIFAAQDDIESALEAWSRATHLAPNHADAHRKLAQGWLMQDQPRLAARQLLTLAAVFQSQGSNQQALEQVQEARELIGDDPAISAALTALDLKTPIEPELLSEAPPEDIPEEDATLDLPGFADSYVGDLIIDEDPFAFAELEPDASQQGGLVAAAQQNAMAELANVIFEDNNNSYAGTIPRDELNMLIIQAIDLQSRHSLAEAVNNFRQVIRAGANSAALYFNLGLLNKELGQYDEAAKMLKASAQADEFNIPAQFALGQTYYAAKNLQMAIRHFVEAVKLNDLETVDHYKAQILLEYYESLADHFIAQGASQKITNFITALEKFFAKPGWQQRVYQARQRMNSVAEDDRLMSLAEFLETPETEIVISTLSLTSEYLKRNLLMTASEECLRAIQKAPSYLPLHARLAEILLKQDHTDAAINKYLYIAKVYQIRNQLDQAINVFQKILRLAPMDVTVRSKLINLYISSQNVDQALDQYLTLANSYYQLAQVDRALEKYTEALKLTADVANADSWKAEILSSMGDIYNQRFDWSRATTAFEELRKIRPTEERTLRQLVDLYFKQRKSEPGIAILDNLLSLYNQQNQAQKSLELLRELVANYPENMMLRQRLAVIYSRHQLKKEAIAEYDALGEMQMEKGLWDEAAQTIQQILTLGPEDAEGYRLLLSKIRGGG